MSDAVLSSMEDVYKVRVVHVTDVLLSALLGRNPPHSTCWRPVTTSIDLGSCPMFRTRVSNNLTFNSPFVINATPFLDLSARIIVGASSFGQLKKISCLSPVVIEASFNKRDGL